ncbi:helix-turn-helix domain-containing protein [Pelotomaculum propionicicum]|uniref:Transcriptional regulatory protein LiaR n=1 Tax=Pelotomaculum propionicicum TaxID=258475 RepID=A0A4Y7RVM8_9FIRM|nr:helix-turn-helix transcriptional regulator [Pelotomaculum propionicicum]NLI13828.1 helix-turn-helix transcriptional regulator [Peptococcaceae bacterium]TEB12789.1 Transcriptional regulatory protein LiaR [Pelotomaculum propionicicum]
MLNDKQFEAYNVLLKQIYLNRDIELLRSIVLEHLPQLVPYDSAAFFLVEPETHHFLEPCCVGLDKDKFKQYEDYYEDLDLYKKAVFSDRYIPPVDRSSDYMDYAKWAKNEHRSDFLLPQGIYHIACLQILKEGNLLGEISLHRSTGSSNFSDGEMYILKLLHDHLNNTFLGYNESSATVGLCELDSKYNIIEANIPACDILQKQLATGQSVYSYLKEICRDLVKSRRIRPITGAYYRKSLLCLRNRSYPFKTILLEGKEEKKDISFLIIIETGYTHRDISPKFAVGFELTRREIEIAALVARGNTNVEIARKLFLSENTVKTHIKKIFIKTGTGSRSELIYNLFGPPASRTKKIP